MPEDISLVAAPYSELLCRFLINMLAITVLAKAIYYPLHRKKDYLFTFFLFNAVIFLICVLLSTAKLQVGFAFGLFAVFSMIRYRTVTIPVKEMGYFFVCVAIGMINALATSEGYLVLPILSNIVILLLVLFLDKYISGKGEQMIEITYERIALVPPQNRAELITDLTQRTGLAVQRVEVITIDFLRDTALLQVYYIQ